MIIFDYITNFLTILVVGFYVITTLQWFNYKIERVILKFTKYQWHILYFILPVATYYLVGKFYWIYFYFGVLPSLFVWYKKLDKKLIFTARVKRFFALLIGLTLLSYIFDYYFHTPKGVFLPILLSIIGGEFIEFIIFNGYKKQAKIKLSQINPKIIAITASYGKTSIKNFIYQLLQNKFNSYKTPRSVNTLKGIVADINNNLPSNCDIYIVEAGAREKGDIKEIVEFIENQYAVIGKIGKQHIEYFKTIENIIATKKELLLSPKLEKSIIYDDLKNNILNIKSTLNGIEWDLKYNDEVIHLSSPILGGFNAINLSLSFYIAKEFGIETDYLIRKILKIEPIPHRLQKIEVGGKIIIDDSFNGNMEGMLEGIKLAKQHNGRKVIITPGLVEADEEMNKQLAKEINETFNLVIITGALNRKILCENIDKPNKIYLADKNKMETILAENTKIGDLIIFSNDAPNFI